MKNKFIPLILVSVAGNAFADCNSSSVTDSDDIVVCDAITSFGTQLNLMKGDDQVTVKGGSVFSGISGDEFIGFFGGSNEIGGNDTIIVSEESRLAGVDGELFLFYF